MHLKIVDRRFVVLIVVSFPIAFHCISMGCKPLPYLPPVCTIKQDVVVRHLPRAQFRIQGAQNNALQGQMPDSLPLQIGKQLCPGAVDQHDLSDRLIPGLLPCRQHLVGIGDFRPIRLLHLLQRHIGQSVQTLAAAQRIDLLQIHGQHSLRIRRLSVNAAGCQIQHIPRRFAPAALVGLT